MAAALKLRARDVCDLETIAACVQDGLVAIGDMKYLPRERRFALMINRFRWEGALVDGVAPAPSHEQQSGDAEFADQGAAAFERIHSVLTIDRVRGVKRKALEHAATDGVLSLLTLTFDGRYLLIAFAGGGALRLDVEQLFCHLEDLGESWPTVWWPQHSDDGTGGGLA